VFALLVLVSVLLLHTYLYRRAVHDTTTSPRARRIGAGVLVVLGGLAVAAALTRGVLAPETARPLHVAGFTWFAITLYAALVLVVGEVVRLAVRRRFSPDRRRFLARALAGTAAVTGVAAVSYGSVVGRQPRVERREVLLDRLDPAFDGFTIAAVADVHLGPLVDGGGLSEIVALVNGTSPDVVAIVGDLVDGSVDELDTYVAPLTRIAAPTYFVTGNHEYYSGDEEWSEALERMGVSVLRNRSVRIGEPSASFDLVGVDDWAAGRSGYEKRYDLAQAVAGRDPERPSVLLAHQPANWREASKAGIGLQLSGHTHGGQFFPFNLAVSAIWEHDVGHFEENGRHLYVSRGTGFWGPPVRVGAPPEIVHVTLLS